MKSFASCLFLCLMLLFACTHKQFAEPHITIETSYGDIEVELYPTKAPKTVAAFLGYVNSGLYKNGSFYRVLKRDDLEEKYNSGILQGGIYESDPAGMQKLPGIPHESPAETGLSHVSGTISLARTLPGTASSEFFICIGDQLQFDSSRRTNPDGLGYAAFGKVVSGMTVLRMIKAQKNTGEKLISPVKIMDIKKI